MPEFYVMNVLTNLCYLSGKILYLSQPLCVCEASVVQRGMSVAINCHSTTDGTEAPIILLMWP